MVSKKIRGIERGFLGIDNRRVLLLTGTDRPDLASDGKRSTKGIQPVEAEITKGGSPKQAQGRSVLRGGISEAKAVGATGKKGKGGVIRCGRVFGNLGKRRRKSWLSRNCICFLW
ncbi:hypothetical protein U1Q18_027486 [Sarracenia purpurea var. burkii]